jgi:hypothetical protein
MVKTPIETTRLTAVPPLTSVPAAGLSLITLPEGTVLLDAVVTVPSFKPAPVMADVAADCVIPTTLGTATPVETTRLTPVPQLTSIPPAGFWLITSPIGTVLLDAVVTVTAKHTPVMADVAAACVSPTTLGTTVPTVSVKLCGIETL